MELSPRQRRDELELISLEVEELCEGVVAGRVERLSSNTLSTDGEFTKLYASVDAAAMLAVKINDEVDQLS